MKLPRTFKAILFSLLLVAFVTGTVWFGFEKWVRVPGALGEDRHPLEAILLRIHGTIAYGTVLSLGYLLRAHVEPGLKGTRRKRSGSALLGVFAALVVTAVIQLYGSEGGFRGAAGSVHLWVGLSLPVFFGIHLLRAR